MSDAVIIDAMRTPLPERTKPYDDRKRSLQPTAHYANPDRYTP